ncbi:histidinol-phosphate transaminase [Oceanibaculum pacificum]|uniref:Histidinol-phosphate aminotransferase n=1 Tax=Oceanibaculum pacificum TaxID=580166 RepID=A0A154WF07_9PROT|nr:histidinol-phosphate transaminase [Oceanibaculum pacificum]KZD12108.1 histidinol-phosphate aminotransferase [Oceanibaculum pacificum]
MSLPKPRPGILDLKPYIATHGSSKHAKVIKLSANEGALGPSPKALEAYRSVAENLHRYPEGGSANLARAIARKHGIDEARVICGNGSDELIEVIIKAFAGHGDEVVYTEYGFRMFPITTLAHSATPVMAPEKDFTVDLDAILAKVTDKTRIVFLANPNNPTGTYKTAEAVKAFHAKLPSDVVLVLDAAYAEFVSKNDYSAGIELVEQAQNVIMLRTFSKLYALAGLRLGWCYGSPYLIDILNRVRGPFNVNLAAQAAGVAALEDTAFLEKARSHNEKVMPWTVAELEKLGLKVTPTVTNFVLVEFPHEASKNADAALAHLAERGILVREMRSYNLPHHLRFSVGTEDEMQQVIAALKELLT